MACAWLKKKVSDPYPECPAGQEDPNIPGLPRTPYSPNECQYLFWGVVRDGGRICIGRFQLTFGSHVFHIIVSVVLTGIVQQLVDATFLESRLSRAVSCRNTKLSSLSLT